MNVITFQKSDKGKMAMQVLTFHKPISDIVDIKQADEQIEGVLKGSFEMFDTEMHFTAIQVKRSAEDNLVAVHSDWNQDIETLHELALIEGEFKTTTLPGFDGDWVIFTHPYKR